MKLNIESSLFSYLCSYFVQLLFDFTTARGSRDLTQLVSNELARLIVIE